MAMNGIRPVLEMQFNAFAYPAFEQIVSAWPKRTRHQGRRETAYGDPGSLSGGIGGVERPLRFL